MASTARYIRRGPARSAVEGPPRARRPLGAAGEPFRQQDALDIRIRRDRRALQHDRGRVRLQRANHAGVRASDPVQGWWGDVREFTRASDARRIPRSSLLLPPSQRGRSPSRSPTRGRRSTSCSCSAATWRPRPIPSRTATSPRRDQGSPRSVMGDNLVQVPSGPENSRANQARSQRSLTTYRLLDTRSVSVAGRARARLTRTVGRAG
jgi:hypothetical protein